MKYNACWIIIPFTNFKTPASLSTRYFKVLKEWNQVWRRYSDMSLRPLKRHLLDTKIRKHRIWTATLKWPFLSHIYTNLWLTVPSAKIWEYHRHIKRWVIATPVASQAKNRQDWYKPTSHQLYDIPDFMLPYLGVLSYLNGLLFGCTFDFLGSVDSLITQWPPRSYGF